MKIIFATNNKHKIEEIRQALGDQYEIVGLQDIGITEDIPETQNAIEGNAIQKALYIYNKYKINCFADDTGLEVDALDGRPGVLSARYAGKGCSYDDNVNKLLLELKCFKNRKARFRTVIALIEEGKITTFEGIVEGHIAEEKFGEKGFGYDPVFIPDGYNRSFAEMKLNEKNKISHRVKALQKFINFIKAHTL
jgi:XTP/dITP diphosphohydrolase